MKGPWSDFRPNRAYQYMFREGVHYRTVEPFQDSCLRSAMAIAQRPNVLVQCSGMSVETAAAELAGLSAQPRHVCLLPGPLRLPEGRYATFVVGDVSTLTFQQQTALCAWMDTRDFEVQVISITSIPLLPLVEAGRFLDRLFYRLNLVSVR